MPTFSRSLEQSLHRALALANEHHHEYATLEHLLLALVDDQDAAAVMRACNVDIDKLRRNLVSYVESELDNLVTDGSETEPFAIKEGAPEIPVVYADVIPDLFEERVFVVLGGEYGASTGFDARSLVIKHESEFITERKESLE